MQSPTDTNYGLEAVGNKRKPYLNRRSPIYRFSCDNCPDDYHSASSGDTVAFGDRCTFGGDRDFAWNKMQSDSVSSTSSAAAIAQSRCLSGNDGNESVATNAVDLTTDNLPAVDTPDACDKAALR